MMVYFRGFLFENEFQLGRVVRVVRFLVFSDLHYDHVFDAEKRIQTLVNKLNDYQLDFVISLGDLCFPIVENKKILQHLKNLDIPFYHCIGNHDCEDYELEELKKFFEMDNLHMSFVIGNIKFILFNSCFMEHEGKEVLYHKELYNKKVDLYPVVARNELKWLSDEMLDTERKYVVFSHHSLINDFPRRGIFNRSEVCKLLESRQTILVMNGHDHGSDLKVVKGIPYYTVNSASYIWHGLKEKYAYERKIYDEYPFTKDIILYETPLYSVVEIEDDKVNIIGMDSDYQKVKPEDVGILNGVWNGVSIEPKTKSWKNSI